jgi:hypothetical protein
MRKLRHLLVLSGLYHGCALHVTRREVPYALGKVSDLPDKYPCEQIADYQGNPNH